MMSSLPVVMDLIDVAKSNEDLLQPYILHGSLQWLELKTDDRVTLERVRGDRPWKVCRPGTLYRNGKDYSVTKVHRFKSLDNAIKFLRDW